MSLKEEVYSLIAETFEVKREEIKDDVSLYDALAVDSTEMVEFRIALNKKLGLNLKEQSITNKHSPSQIVEIVAKEKGVEV